MYVYNENYFQTFPDISSSLLTWNQALLEKALDVHHHLVKN